MPKLDIGSKKAYPFWASLAKDILTPFAPTRTSLALKIMGSPEQTFSTEPQGFTSLFHRPNTTKVFRIVKRSGSGPDSNFINGNIPNLSKLKKEKQLRPSSQKTTPRDSISLRDTIVDSSVNNAASNHRRLENEKKFHELERSFLSLPEGPSDALEEEKKTQTIQRRKSRFNTKLGSPLTKGAIQGTPFTFRRKSCHCRECGKNTNLENRSMSLPWKVKMTPKSTKSENKPEEKPASALRKVFASRKSFQADSIARKALKIKI
jgi:hypothetical protein